MLSSIAGAVVTAFLCRRVAAGFLAGAALRTPVTAFSLFLLGNSRLLLGYGTRFGPAISIEMLDRLGNYPAVNALTIFALQVYSQFAQLPLGDRRGGVAHQVRAARGLGERDHFAQ